VDVDRILFYRDCPEQALRVWVNSRVKVVYLGRMFGEVKLTSIEVKSDEPKGPVMHLPIFANVFAGTSPFAYFAVQTGLLTRLVYTGLL